MTMMSTTTTRVSSAAYRDALRHLPGGVSIVTTKRGDVAHGMTVSALVSVSAKPPLVAVVIDQGCSINRLLEGDTACFAVSVLAQDQQDLADRFAFVKDEDRFLEGVWEPAHTGSPVLTNALTSLDCRVASRQPAGSHTIFVGAVEASRVIRPDDPPLLYWNRGYRGLALE
jgi:flavin reductase (DIM6/NTAB) family NADH-FMN oxidoreductase RutF